MPLLVAALLGALIQGAASLVGRVLIALGVGMVVYTGISATVDWAKAQVIASFQGLPADAVQIAAATQVDTAITMIFSAIAARLVLQGLTSGTMKRMVFK